MPFVRSFAPPIGDQQVCPPACFPPDFAVDTQSYHPFPCQYRTSIERGFNWASARRNLATEESSPTLGRSDKHRSCSHPSKAGSRKVSIATPRSFRYRLVGTNVVNATGEDRTGKSFEEVNFFQEHPTALDQYEKGVATHQPIHSLEAFTNLQA